MIIDFYEWWTCKMIAPILDELSEEFKDDIYIYKVNTEDEQELASDFGIRSIPTLLFCPMDENPQQAMGALPKTEIVKAINEILLKKVINNMNKIILVHYINIGGLSRQTAETRIMSYMEHSLPKEDSIINYIVPIENSDSRIECLNPRLLSELDYQEIQKVIDKK